MNDMTGKHIFLFLFGTAAGATAMHFRMKREAPEPSPKLVAEAVKGLSSWH